MSSIEKARAFAEVSHAGHIYGQHDYIFHLDQCYLNLSKLKDFFEDKDLYRNLCIAVYLHDVLEMTNAVTYSQIKDIFGEFVAEICFALAPLKGRNRKEKYRDEYYQEIAKIKYARLIKLIDRISNFSYSVETSDKKKIAMYLNERDKMLYMMRCRDFSCLKEYQVTAAVFLALERMKDEV